MIGNLNRPDDFKNLFEVFELGTETSVHAKNLFVDESAYGHHIEDIRKYLPELEIILSLA